MGGKGGLAQGVFYLSQGEILTYELGGQNGYHGGGGATAYGCGGGYSQLSSNRQGVLLIAGGGGGATQAHDGMPGGSTQKNVSGCDGESGKAGGGGGYMGAVEAIGLCIITQGIAATCIRETRVKEGVLYCADSLWEHLLPTGKNG